MRALPHKNIRAKWFSVRESDAVISAKKKRQIIKEQTNDPLKLPKYLTLPQTGPRSARELDCVIDEILPHQATREEKNIDLHIQDRPTAQGSQQLK
jgi:hypothetical protein